MKISDYIKETILGLKPFSKSSPLIKTKNGLRCKYDMIKISRDSGEHRITFYYGGRDVFFQNIGQVTPSDTITISGVNGDVEFMLS